MKGKGPVEAVVGNVLGIAAAIQVGGSVPALLRGDLSSLEVVTTLGGVAVVWWWLTWLIGSYRLGVSSTDSGASVAARVETPDSGRAVRSEPAVRRSTVVDRASRRSYRVLVVIAPLTMAAMIAMAMGLPLSNQAAAVLTAALLVLSFLSVKHFAEQVAEEDFVHAIRWHGGLAAPTRYDSSERLLIRAGVVSFLILSAAWAVYLAFAF